MKTKKYDIGYGHLGNGLTVWNRLVEKNGDYERIAHINQYREVTFYNKDLPNNIKKDILEVAKNSNCTISATQQQSVFID